MDSILEEAICAVREDEECHKQSEGEWLGNWDYECSVCHEYHDIKTKHCPNCGAKMLKGDVD